MNNRCKFCYRCFLEIKQPAFVLHREYIWTFFTWQHFSLMKVQIQVEGLEKISKTSKRTVEFRVKWKIKFLLHCSNRWEPRASSTKCYDGKLNCFEKIFSLIISKCQSPNLCKESIVVRNKLWSSYRSNFIFFLERETVHSILPYYLD